MASLNQVNLIGYVGDEPKIITTQSQRKMSTFSIGTTEKGFRRQDGTEVPDKTEWHNIVIFGKVAEVAEKYVHKGSMLYIQGRLATRSYEKDGQKRYITEVIAERMQLLDRKSGISASSPETQTAETDEVPF